MATHSSVLAWGIPRQKNVMGYSPLVAKSDTPESDRGLRPANYGWRTAATSLYYTRCPWAWMRSLRWPRDCCCP